MKKYNKSVSVIIASIIGLGTVTAAQADAVKDFYKGKTVKIYVGAGAGGGYGFFGRAFGKFYGQYIPGKPNVIVINKPGAGGTKMTNCIGVLQSKLWQHHVNNSALRHSNTVDKLFLYKRLHERDHIH